MTYLDVWRSGTFPEKQQESECTAVLVMFRGFRKLLYSMYRITLHVTQFTRPSPVQLVVLQATNAGVR